MEALGGETVSYEGGIPVFPRKDEVSGYGGMESTLKVLKRNVSYRSWKGRHPKGPEKEGLDLEGRGVPRS